MASSGDADDVVVGERAVASAGPQLAARLIRSSGAGLLVGDALVLHGEPPLRRMAQL